MSGIGWLKPEGGPSGYDPYKNREALVREHGEVGEVVLEAWDEVDFCCSGMPDEYLGYAERFLQAAEERGIGLTAQVPNLTVLVELVKTSLHPDQLGTFISEEQVRQVADGVSRRLQQLKPRTA